MPELSTPTSTPTNEESQPVIKYVRKPSSKPCSVEGCGRPFRARGLCATHWWRLRNNGNPNVANKRSDPAFLEAKFWGQVDKTPGHGPNGDCWLWTGSRDHGYGQFTHGRGFQCRAHRLAYELTKGPIPAGLLIMHSCDNPPCVNPAHLSPGTEGDNIKDAQKKKRLRTGDEHWTHKNPGRLARGEHSGARRHPEAYPRGEAVHNSKLTFAKVAEARERYAAGGVTFKQLGDEFGVSAVTVRDAVKKKTWA